METPYHFIHNHHEQAVFGAVKTMADEHPDLANDELLADVACVALNRIPPRYIRHNVDFAFYLSDSEREENARMVADAVTFAFDFVRARRAMRVRT